MVRGHILEYRLRWRSNGYSLGTVAKTLTLAPRQVRRIQKIEWERLERTRREEQHPAARPGMTRSLAIGPTRTRSRRACRSGRGASRVVDPAPAPVASGSPPPASSSAAVAAHSGLAAVPRHQAVATARAAEEQSLRDSIRRFGDSLRKLDSLVVTEVSQEESVTGTTEIVRNANFGHSLTVIYYQILRHLKLETEFAAVRECLFVPFAVTPLPSLGPIAGVRRFVRALLRKYSTLSTTLRTSPLASPDPRFRQAASRPSRSASFMARSPFRLASIVRQRHSKPASMTPSWTVLQPVPGVPALAHLHARLPRGRRRAPRSPSSSASRRRVSRPTGSTP